LVFDKDELRKLIKEKSIGATQDLNDFLRDVTKEVVEALYEGELTDHLGHGKNQKSENGNIRNGFTKKTVQTKTGEIELEVPRDREGTFEPQVVKKRQRDITGIEDRVISMYGLGMSTRDIQSHIDEIYGQSLSPETISTITDTVLERAKEWQNRPLQPVYPIIFLDALVIKLKQDRVVKTLSCMELLPSTWMVIKNV
jgi:putative transposase